LLHYATGHVSFMEGQVARYLIAMILLAAMPAAALANADADRCYDISVSDGDPDEGIAACSRAIESGGLADGKLAAAYTGRGLAYIAKESYNAAIKDFDAALKAVPDFEAAAINRGVARGLKGEFQNALTDFDEVIEVDPFSARAHNGRCYTLAQMGKTDEALKACERAFKLDPNEPYILDSRGYAYFKSGDFRRALADYDLALQIDPGKAKTLFSRGVTKLRLGNRDDGQRDLAAARTLDSRIDRKMVRIGVVP
jgi:tetratricopeptide (TPR) repeat protein